MFSTSDSISAFNCPNSPWNSSMSLFRLIVLFKILNMDPSYLPFTTKKYLEYSSKWSVLEAVRMMTRLVLKSSSVGCLNCSL